jgi:hypothetical protein
MPIWKFTGIGQELLPLIQKPFDEQYFESIGRFFLAQKAESLIAKITERRQDGDTTYQVIKKVEAMALIQCHECQGRVSDHARTCPQCGAPVIATIKRRQKQELQWLLFKLVFAAVVGIVFWFWIHHVFNMALAVPKNLQQQQQPAPH